MDRNQAKQLLPIIEAFSKGKQMQFLFDVWKDVDEIEIREFLENPELYRIKPEPKYRPFNNTDECWQEMQKHQPFGWMKFKYTERGYYMLTSVAVGVGVGINDSLFSYERIFNDYIFADGTPFGVKVEE